MSILGMETPNPPKWVTTAGGIASILTIVVIILNWANNLDDSIDGLSADVIKIQSELDNLKDRMNRGYFPPSRDLRPEFRMDTAPDPL